MNSSQEHMLDHLRNNTDYKPLSDCCRLCVGKKDNVHPALDNCTIRSICTRIDIRSNRQGVAIGQDEPKNMTRLSIDFVPSPFDVICARGKQAKLHNQQFRAKIHESSEAYAKAETKLYKSLVVSSVVAMVVQYKTVC